MIRKTPPPGVGKARVSAGLIILLALGILMGSSAFQKQSEQKPPFTEPESAVTAAR